MPRPYSNDLRTRVVEARLAGGTVRGVARRFDVAPSTVSKWTARFRRRGSVAPDRFGGHRRPILEPWRGLVLELVRATPHITIDRLREHLADGGATVARSTVWRFLRRLRLSFKKNSASPAKANGRTSPSPAGAGNG